MPRKLKFAAPIWPSAAIEAAYTRDLRKQLVQPMAADLLRSLQAAWRDAGSVVGDARAFNRAAGVMCTHAGHILLLRRTDGMGWAFPAGGLEEGETPIDAARRECAEEIGWSPPTLEPHAVQQHGEFLFYTFRGRFDTVPPLHIALNDEHDRASWMTPAEALALSDLHPGVRALLNMPAQDARPNPDKLRVVMERWGKKWTARLETLAEKMARQFADASRNYVDRGMLKSFRDAGLTIRWRPTKRMLEGYAAVVYENVQLIKSIPAKFLTDVQSDVWLSVTKGADAAALTEKIRESYGVSWRRAAFISADQTAKAKAVFEAARRQEIGVKRAKWLHSHAGREPRPTHVAMNGKLYDVARGMYDSDPRVREYVQPGELIRCRCSSAAEIPGFDD